jgi:hypothetical protein
LGPGDGSSCWKSVVGTCEKMYGAVCHWDVLKLEGTSAGRNVGGHMPGMEGPIPVPAKRTTIASPELNH